VICQPFLICIPRSRYYTAFVKASPLIKDQLGLTGSFNTCGKGGAAEDGLNGTDWSSGSAADGGGDMEAVSLTAGEEASCIDELTSLLVRENAICIQNASFYQDRLGTNIGKALKKRVAFFAGERFHRAGQKTRLSTPFYTKSDRFTKTGSGQA
jgi:hypothetical protein